MLVRKHRSAGHQILIFVVALLVIGVLAQARAEPPSYEIEQGVALADAQNPEIIIARKKVEGAHGGLIEARSGYLPSVISSGFADKRQTQTDTRLRQEDYSASVRALENVYTGGAVSNQVGIAELVIEKQRYEREEVRNRVAMDVRVGFYDVLLNRAKVRVRENSVRALGEELKTQEERLRAGIVGTLNVGRADVNRAEIKARQIDVEIEDRQYLVDRSELRPHVQVFSGYEVYNERDPLVGQEFNHGYLVGVNATWNLFDGYATKGRMQATRSRREAAVAALEAARRAVASEVRSAFLDLQQGETVLETTTKSVQTADESLEITKTNLAAGLGTQLDILQAAADVTRTRTTRLSAIYLHNVALARLARACGSPPEALNFAANRLKKSHEKQALDMAAPPAKLTKR